MTDNSGLDFEGLEELQGRDRGASQNSTRKGEYFIRSMVIT